MDSCKATLEAVNKALSLPEFEGESAQRLMMPMFRQSVRPPDRTGQPRLGSVLLLLYCRDDQIHLLLTKRREDLNKHAGQISFPGGSREDSESFLRTALRETEEEVGVKPADLTILGRLTPIYILPSDFEVHPFVAWYHNGRSPRFIPQDAEVAEIIETPLYLLLSPDTLQKETRLFAETYEMQVPYFAVGNHKVWGATAMMLSEFLERLRTATAVDPEVS